MANSYASFAEPQIATRPWDPVSGVDASLLGMQANMARNHALEQMLTERNQKEAELQRYTAMTPLELDIKGDTAAKARAKMTRPGYYDSLLAGDEADARSKVVKADIDEGTKASTIGATNSKNQNSMFNDGLLFLDQADAIMTGAGDDLDGQMRWQNVLSRVPEQHRSMFSNTWGPQAREQLKTIRSIVENTPDQRRALAKDKQQQGSQERIARGNNSTQVRVAEIGAESREYIASLRNEYNRNKENFQQFLTRYAAKKAAGQPTTPEEDSMAQMVETMMYQARIAGAGQDPVAQRGSLVGIPPAPRTPPPSAVPAQGGDLKTKVEAAGEKYDPQTYDYRINPQTGKVEKKRK